MNSPVSANTQAILLLTAPLIVGRGGYSSELLTPSEYKRLARILRDNEREPADLLSPEAGELLQRLQGIIDSGRLTRLLGRGFLLSQAIERWQARAIWVVSRADPDYPRRLKVRLKETAPPILYGCGDAAILETGGLAIVGSRHVDDALIEYTESVSRLAARARQTVVSGGARGIDQAAMRGALQAGGCVAGVLADSLERLALVRDHREFLMDSRLVLISPYDPAAGFDVGHAMQRNKIVYALADAALIVSTDYENGGTWMGAIEQLENLHLVPVYVRSSGDIGKGLRALREKGSLPWPNPSSPEEFERALAIQVDLIKDVSRQESLPFPSINEPASTYEAEPGLTVQVPEPPSEPTRQSIAPAEELFAKVKGLLLQMKTPKTEAEVATDLQVSRSQAREWLHRLVKEGVLKRKQKPLRYYVPSDRQENLFNTSD
ncbi:MAG: DNA-processing protein DprA [Chloroflexi bacterium]|nr:DNA-processing protein DprA [Chloroflexota bacterium]